MATAMKEYLDMNVVWKKSADPEYPYSAMIEGEKCLIRLNDFPDEHLYTLLANGIAVADFDDWPAAWLKVEAKVLATSAEGMVRH
ncbi:MAG: hypothetical protein ACRD82_21895 [Blastocatellia bacterium]